MLPNHCGGDESLARFIFNRKYIRAEEPRLKPQAFEPNPRDNSTSVFRTDGLSDEEVWAIREEVNLQPDRTMHGRADLKVGAVINLGLEVNKAEPPLRHANIQNWSSDKNVRITIAQQIAAQSVFVPVEGS